MKQIPGFPDYYITKAGTIYSNRSGKLTKRKPYLSWNGYLQLKLRLPDGQRTMMRVHRLVALTYIPNPHNLLLVDHLDKNRLNNHYRNLRWVSHAMNNANPTKPSQTLSSLTYNDRLGVVEAYQHGTTIRELANQHNLTPRQVRGLVRRLADVQ